MTNSIKDLLKEEGKEFWIERKSFSSHVLAAWEEKPDETTYRIAKDITHVIEASYAHRLKETLEKCVKENEELRAEVERLKGTLESGVESIESNEIGAIKAAIFANNIDCVKIAKKEPTQPYEKELMQENKTPKHSSAQLMTEHARKYLKEDLDTLSKKYITDDKASEKDGE